MNTPTPSCPRCGYDLSGDVATWTDACPLHSTCPECGLRVDWAGLWWRSARAWWLFELDNTSRAKAFLRTTFHALRPSRFWSLVRIEDHPNPRRLALFLVLLATTVHLSIAIPSGLAVAKQVWGPLIPPSPTTPPVRPFPVPVIVLVRPTPPTNWERLQHALAMGAQVALNPYATSQPRTWPVRVSPVGPSFVSGAVALFLLPFTVAAARGIFKEGRAKRTHFWRVWAYGWAGPAIMVLASKIGLSLLLRTRMFDPQVFLPHNDDGFMVTPDLSIWLGPAMFAWAARWWYIAADRYLRWERPLAVTLSACTASFFLVFGLTLLYRGWDLVLAI